MRLFRKHQYLWPWSCCAHPQGQLGTCSCRWWPGEGDLQPPCLYPSRGYCHQHVPCPSVPCPRRDFFLSAWIVNLWVVQWSPQSPTRCLAPARCPVTVGSVRGEHGCDVRDGTQALEGVQSGPRSPLPKLRIEWYFTCSAASLKIPGLFSSCLSENQLFV